MIILTAPEAAQVRGQTATNRALDPVILADGVTYFLPEEVLADPAHALHHDFLATLPTRDVAQRNFRRHDQFRTRSCWRRFAGVLLQLRRGG